MKLRPVMIMCFLGSLPFFTSCKTTSETTDSSDTKLGYGEGRFFNKNVLFSQSYKAQPKLRCYFFGKIHFGRNLHGMKKAGSLCSKPMADSFVKSYANSKYEAIGPRATGAALRESFFYQSFGLEVGGFDVNSWNYKGNYNEAAIEVRANVYRELCESVPEAEFGCPESFNGLKYLDADAEEWDIDDPSVAPM